MIRHLQILGAEVALCSETELTGFSNAAQTVGQPVAGLAYRAFCAAVLKAGGCF